MGFLDAIFKRDRAAKPPHPGFANVQSGGSSAAPAANSTTAAARLYIVVNGDSLAKIARHHYGDANKWRTIYDANRDVIKDPDFIYPGQSFRIPEA